MSIGMTYALYLLFAAGGVGLYLAMPRGEGSSAKVGAVVGFGAIAGLLALCGQAYMAPHTTNIFYYLFAAIALLAAGRVVTHREPTYSAVYFALVVLSVAVLLVMQRAEFLAVALVIIYAGAILVTYAFVIMLAQQSGGSKADSRSREPLFATLIAFVIMGTVAGRVGDLRQLPASPPAGEGYAAGVMSDTPADQHPTDAEVGNTLAVGRAMFGSYVVVVQLAGLLLLVAMVGAIAVSRKRIPVEEWGPTPPEPGEIGKTVPPF